MKPRKIKLSAGVCHRIRVRKTARMRLVYRAREFATAPVGSDRTKLGAALSQSVRRVRDLFGRRAFRVVSAATRRAFV